MKSSEKVQGLMAVGFARPLAETMLAACDSYSLTPTGFDEEYWLWRLEKAGASAEVAREFVFSLRQPAEFRKKYHLQS